MDVRSRWLAARRLAIALVAGLATAQATQLKASQVTLNAALEWVGRARQAH